MREVVVEKYEIGKEVKLPMEPVISCTCTCRDTKTRYSLSFWSIIKLCRRDGRVVQGLALELLCNNNNCIRSHIAEGHTWGLG
jgi:hypothetical protein